MKEECHYNRQDIVDYYANNLSREEETEMQEHILSCDICKNRLAGIRDFADELTPHSQNKSVEREPEEPDTSKINKRPIRKYLLIATSVAAVVVMIILMYPSKETGYPIRNIDGDEYGNVDSAKVDSAKIIGIKIDTIGNTR